MKKYLIMIFLAISMSLSAQTSYIYEISTMSFAIQQEDGTYRAQSDRVTLDPEDYVNVVISTDAIYILNPGEEPLVIFRNTTFHRDENIVEYRCKDSSGKLVRVSKGPMHIAFFVDNQMIWMGYKQHWYASEKEETGKTFNYEDNFNGDYGYSDTRLCLAE